MAIRLRKIGGNLVAFCAAKTPPHPDDLYIDDEAHHALTVKFEEDFVKMGMFNCEYGCIKGKVFHQISGVPEACLNWTPCPKHGHLIETYNDETYVQKESQIEMDKYKSNELRIIQDVQGNPSAIVCPLEDNGERILIEATPCYQPESGGVLKDLFEALKGGDK